MNDEETKELTPDETLMLLACTNAQALHILLQLVNSGPSADLAVSAFTRGMGQLVQSASKKYGNELGRRQLLIDAAESSRSVS